MRRVFVASPYAGQVERNLRYLEACMWDCLQKEEAPFAAHRLFPGVLDDGKLDERSLGIRAGLAWLDSADALVAYTDLGISKGMREEMAAAQAAEVPIEYRTLELWDLSELRTRKRRSERTQ
jgi:hypothetical protein